jgi:uncharacterized protein (TIGR02001 family)
MRNLLVSTAVIAATAAFAAPGAFAQDAASGPTVSGNVTLTTDYVWRGVSQSAQDVALQGGLDLDTGTGIYAGFWGSSVDFDSDSDVNLELDFYGGYAFEVAGVGLDVGFIYYAYPDAETDDFDFYEVYGKVSKEFGAFGIGGSLNYDPDNENLYADVGASYAILENLSVDGTLGKYLEGFDEYSQFTVGATYSVGGVDLDLRYYQNDIDGIGDFENNVVFSIGRAM